MVLNVALAHSIIAQTENDLLSIERIIFNLPEVMVN